MVRAGRNGQPRFAMQTPALEQRLAQCALAVCYPDNTTEASLPSAQLLWTVRDPAAPAPAAADWSAGNLDQLVSVIRLTPAQLGDPDSVAAALSSSLDGAVARLSEGQKRELAKTLDLPESAGSAKGNALDTAAKRALLVIVTAVMFHARLDSHRHTLRPEFDNRTVPPSTFSGRLAARHGAALRRRRRPDRRVRRCLEPDPGARLQADL